MAIDPTTTALVLVEFQNDFATEGGTLHGAVSPVMQATQMLDNTVRAVGAARRAGFTVVHVPLEYATGYHELPARPYGILERLVSSRSFVTGEWGSQIVSELSPEPSDIVVQGSRGLDSFTATNLDFVLRGRGVRTVALAGFLTNCCVESTMRTAYEKGYDVYTLTDCMAATSQEEHDNAIAYDFPMFSHPVTSKEFLDPWGQELEVEFAGADWGSKVPELAASWVAYTMEDHGSIW